MASFRKRRGQESALDYGADMVQRFVQKKNLPYFTLHAQTRVKSPQAWAHGLVAQVPDFSNGGASCSSRSPPPWSIANDKVKHPVNPTY
jgi:hypothetical protein